MKKLVMACLAMIVMLASGGPSAEVSEEPFQGSGELTYPASLAEAKIAYIPWNAASTDKLRALDKAAIVEFYKLSDPPLGEDFEGFTWADLVGDGKYELLITTLTKCCTFLDVYWQKAPGQA